MGDEIFFVLGGIGMFLMGMQVMTTGLREAAGDNLRAWLTRFTTTPLRGVATGAVTTAVVQSSSATTVMVVGFVGAGLLTLGQALGVLYGANIGTTATGWLVSILGFKLQLDSLAMALLLPASLADLLARGIWARLGRILAGLCLFLIGLDLMQGGMATVTEDLAFDRLPAQSAWGLLVLIGLGAGFTILVQASSAALALALILLQGGAITLTQAAAIVIGMNIGTTFTALLAALGGSVTMRQTAIANLLFNIATSLLAFPLVLLGAGALNWLAQATDPLTALLLFHMGFNLLGTALFLPVTARFANLVRRLVPERPRDRIYHFDSATLQDPGVALLEAQTGASAIAQRMFSALGAALSPQPDLRGIAALAQCGDALDDLREFLGRIRLTADIKAQEEAFSNLLHQTDHLSRLLGRAGQTGRIETLMRDDDMLRPALAVGESLRRLSSDIRTPSETGRLARLQLLIKHRKTRHRRGLLLGGSVGSDMLSEVFAHTDATRWLDRTVHHAERVVRYHISSPLAESRAAIAARNDEI